MPLLMRFIESTTSQRRKEEYIFTKKEGRIFFNGRLILKKKKKLENNDFSYYGSMYCLLLAWEYQLRDPMSVFQPSSQVV